MFMHPDTLSWTPNVSYFRFNGNGLAARSNVSGVIVFLHLKSFEYIPIVLHG